MATKTKTQTKKPVVVKAPKAAPIKLFDSTDAISKAIVGIQGRGKKLSRDIHVAACSILVHTNKHHDVTLAMRLVAAVPDLARRNALREWFIAHGVFEWNEEKKAFAYDGTRETFLEEAMVKPFWAWKPEKHEIPFDARKSVHLLLQKITKAKNIPADVVTHIKAAEELLIAHGTKPVLLSEQKVADPLATTEPVPA